MSRLFSILFVFFSLIVAACEIPEFNNLAEDPSNDEEVFAWQRQTPVCTPHDAKKPRKEDLPLDPITFPHAEKLHSPLGCFHRNGPGPRPGYSASS